MIIGALVGVGMLIIPPLAEQTREPPARDGLVIGDHCIDVLARAHVELDRLGGVEEAAVHHPAVGALEDLAGVRLEDDPLARAGEPSATVPWRARR